MPHLKQTIRRVQKRKKNAYFLKQRGEKRLQARITAQEVIALNNAKMPHTSLVLDILHSQISKAEESLGKLTLAVLSISFENHIYNYDYELDLTTVVTKHLKKKGY